MNYIEAVQTEKLFYDTFTVRVICHLMHCGKECRIYLAVGESRCGQKLLGVLVYPMGRLRKTTKYIHTK